MVALGVLFHGIGGFGAGSFYIAFKKVKNWAWESYWFVNGLFTWLIMPWCVALFTVPELWTILREVPAKAGWLTFFFGFLWGIGNLTFGLSLRYLGMSLGMALTLGLTTAFGTLVPPLFFGTFKEIISSVSGWTTLAGIGICLFGIALCGWAGMTKENELSKEEKQKYVKEFNFRRGILIALFSGITSACFAFAVQAGKPIRELSESHHTPAIWSNSAVIVIIMAGALLTNGGCCLIMNIKNRTLGNYLKSGNASLSKNYLFCAIAGIAGFSEFMFFGMGTTQMGKYDFASFSIHLAFVIIFSNMWGLITHEWTGCSRRTYRRLFAGISVLLLSTVVMGLGNYFAGK